MFVFVSVAVRTADVHTDAAQGPRDRPTSLPGQV